MSTPAAFWEQLQGYADGAGLPLLRRAHALAERAHRGQLRDGGEEPYLNHPLRVALLLAEELGRAEPGLLSVALLHDVLEDSDVRVEEIAVACGAAVAEAVVRLTKAPAPAAAKAARDAAYYAALAEGPDEARLVKAADRLDNLRSMRALGEPGRLARYVEESRQHILPLAAGVDPRLHAALLAECAGSIP